MNFGQRVDRGIEVPGARVNAPPRAYECFPSPAMPGQLRDFGFFVVAIRPDLFGDADEFRGKVSDYMAALGASRPLDPDRPVRAPFARSAALRAERLDADEIQLEPAIAAAVQEIAGSASRRRTH